MATDGLHLRLVALVVVVLFFLCLRPPKMAKIHSVPGRTKAYVLSTNHTRWLRTSALLERCGLHAILVTPMALHTRVLDLESRLWPVDVMKTMRKTLSNKLTHISLWRSISSDQSLPDNGFSLVFEDDVSLDARVEENNVLQIVETTARLAQDAGLFYLGICGPVCDDHVDRLAGVSYGRCVGRCAHAYGVHKWRGAWLYEELAAATEKSRHLHSFEHTFYADVFLHFGSELMPDFPKPVVGGADCNDARGARDHWGIFFQDRTLFPSQIQI